MKKLKKAFLVCLCFVLVMGLSIVGTVAYLTDTDATKNTFTVGKVDISLDEAKVNPDGTLVDAAERVKENAYHLVPGQTYVKDPTVTVEGDSEEAYIRMLLVINCKAELDAIFAPDGMKLDEFFGGYSSADWLYVGKTAQDNSLTYEFRYKESVDPEGADKALPPLFTSITVPGFLDGDDMKSIENLSIDVYAHAIQKAGFDSAELAWLAFDARQ